MKISHEIVSSALVSWLRMPEMTQERATRLITCAYLSGGEAFDLALHRIEFDDGTVDYDAWRSNRINIFQRWRKCETSGQRKKMQLLTPAILAAIKAENADLYKQVTAGNSVDYLVSRLLKENADAASAALNDAPLIDFERECDEAEQAITALRRAYRQQRHDQ